MLIRFNSILIGFISMLIVFNWMLIGLISMLIGLASTSNLRFVHVPKIQKFDRSHSVTRHLKQRCWMKKLDHFIKNYFICWMKKLDRFTKKIFFFENSPFGFLFNVFYPVFQKRIQTHDFLVSAFTTILVFHNQCSPDQNSKTFK
jgi:hypothetical protein